MPRDDHGFTLLEVLLAVVLLAAVIGVCAPFLSSTPRQDHLGSQSEFYTDAEQLIAAAQSSNSQLLDFEDYATIAQTRGWACRRVDPSRAVNGDAESLGEWVLLSNGPHEKLCWAATHSVVVSERP